jgi:RIO kinase 1
MLPKLPTHGRLAGDLEDDEWDALPTPPRRRSPAASRSDAQRKKVNDHLIRDEILRHAGAETVPERLGGEAVFNPAFSSSKHERKWILDYLGAFYDDKQITDVLRRVKGGKEATVYCCAAHPATGLALIAAKVYRPRIFRQLRNDSRYRQGRSYLDERGKVVRDEKLLAAIQKKSSTGQALVHSSWLEHEYRTLSLLHAAGVDVPRPVSHGNNTILMEYLGDAEWPAPALQAVRLEAGQARPLFARLLRNIELMLANQRIHGDLSAFNVLYWEGDIRLIDFPQAVAPAENPDAFDILERDIRRVCQYFERYGIHSDPGAIARDLWARYGVVRADPFEFDEQSLDGGDDTP